MTATAEPKTTETKAATSPIISGEIRMLSLDQLHESPWNPRKTFNPVALEELSNSLKASGQIESIIVRPLPKQRGVAAGYSNGYEIAAGHRRYRAAKLAGLTHLEAKVRELDDRTFLEILTVDNLQRDDLHALEEAQGFVDLMKHAGYDVAKIAERTGRSTRYVYDRITMHTKLTPEAKQLFLAGKFEAGHAIELARIPEQKQKELIGTLKDPLRGTLFEPEEGDPEEVGADGTLKHSAEDRAAVKPISVRELRAWINDHVRLEPDAIDEFLFPEAAALVNQSIEADEKVVHITREFQTPHAARSDEHKTYGEQAWQRADGKFKSKVCDYAVTGVVVAGPDRSDAFRVCVNKDKCHTHWPEQAKRAEQRKAEAKKTAKQEAKDPAAAAVVKSRSFAAVAASRLASRSEAQKEKELERQRWSKTKEALFVALAAKVRKAPAGASGPLAALFWNSLNHPSKGCEKLVPLGKTAEDLVRAVAFSEIYDAYEGFDGMYLKGVAKDFGIDWKKVMDAVAPLPAKNADVGKTAKKPKSGKAKAKK